MNSSYIYVVFDLVGNSYSPVFESKNDKTAKRDFLSLYGKKRLDLGDFELLCIAKLEKVNNEEESSLKVSIVEDGSRVVEFEDSDMHFLEDKDA